MGKKILVINPGSTSTKVAVYEDEKVLFEKNIEHDAKELEKFEKTILQKQFRRDVIVQTLKEQGISLDDLDAVCARGGTLPPVKSGAYVVNKEMVTYLENVDTYAHAADLAAIIAYDLAEERKIKAYVYDPISVDERPEIAHITGMPIIPRIALGHVLNSRAMAMKHARSIGKNYRDLVYIVAHLGGGSSFSVHKGGKIIDGLSDDEGPMSPERAGRVQATRLIEVCLSGKYTPNELKGMTRGKAGLMAHLGTADLKKVEVMVKGGDQKASMIVDAMTYQQGKAIAELASVVCGKVDYILLTGGAAYSKMVTDKITERVSFIAPVVLMPGACEMEALAFGALRVLNGEEEAREFTL